MKIKITGRWANLPMTDKYEWVFDVYHGFGTPIFCPIFTKWIIDKGGLSVNELELYLYPFLTGSSPLKGKTKIIVDL